MIESNLVAELRPHTARTTEPASRNRLLMSLGAASAALISSAPTRSFAAGGRLGEWKDGGDAAYFPEVGIIGLQGTSADGRARIVCNVGAEGALGLCVALGGAVGPFEVAAVTPCRVRVVSGALLRSVLFSHPDALRAVTLYLANAEVQARRDVMCASLHSGIERLADRLLHLSQILGDRRVPVTQEGLGLSLGLARTTVTAFVQDLKDAGITRHGRGWIGILQPESLATVSCGCSTGFEAG